jgi:uncharacterized OB-fold protein
MSSSRKPLPRLEGPDLPYWEGLREGEIRLQRCTHCGTHRFPASRWCSACRQEGSERVAVAPTGIVESFCVFHKGYFPGFDPPYAVIQVKLDCGVRLFSNVAGPPDADVRIGERIAAVFERATPDVTLLKFKPADGVSA